MCVDAYFIRRCINIYVSTCIRMYRPIHPYEDRYLVFYTPIFTPSPDIGCTCRPTTRTFPNMPSHLSTRGSAQAQI